MRVMNDNDEHNISYIMFHKMYKKQVINAYTRYIIEDHIRSHGEITTKDIDELSLIKWYNIYYSVYDDVQFKIPNKIDILYEKIDNIDIHFGSKL